MEKYVLHFRSEKRPSSYLFCVCVLLVIFYICCSWNSYDAWELSSEGHSFWHNVYILWSKMNLCGMCLFFFCIQLFERDKDQKCSKTDSLYVWKFLSTFWCCIFHIALSSTWDTYYRFKIPHACGLGMYVAVGISSGFIEISDLRFGLVNPSKSQ